MTMFGRDSIFTSLQALPFTPELAATTLRALGDWQGTALDDFRDEDPGRILHEMRYGEMTAFEERPHSPYYGCADATPLYVVLLDEYERWTGDTKLVRELEHEARAALNWIDEYADLQGNGYVCVQAPQRGDRPREPVLEGLLGLDLLPRRQAAGLPAGDLRAPGLRLRREGARRPAGARSSGRIRRLADRLEKEAADLKRRFNRDFWVEDGEYFALALDADGSQVDALTSNNGHLLWSGIVDKSKAKAVARHLMGPTAVLRLGRAHAGRGRGPLQPDRLPRRHRLAVRQLVHRLGPAPLRLQGRGRADRRRHPRRRRVLRRAAARRRSAATTGALTKYPVQYPTACSPQAWSTGTPLLLLRTMLGLEPIGDHLVVDPALPDRHRPSRAARHPGALGPHRRLRTRAGRDGETTALTPAGATVDRHTRIDARR